MDTFVSSIVVALITGGLSLVGVIISNFSANKNIENQLITSQAVTNTKLEHLTEEVRKHNTFAEKIPQLEIKISALEKDIADLKESRNEQ